MTGLNILVLTAYPPALGVHGGAMRMYYNLKFLAAKHRVTLVSFVEHESERELLGKLEPLGIEVRSIRRLPSQPRDLWMPKPLEHYEFSSPEMAAQVQQILKSQRFDVIQAEYFQMAQHVPEKASQRKILTLHEVEFANVAEALRKADRLWTKVEKFYDWMVQLNYEVRSCGRFDSIVCMTTEDARLLTKFVPSSKLRTIHIGVDSQFFDGGQRPDDACRNRRMLFVGNYRHRPNRESVHYFVDRILPGIHRRVPDAEFWIVGGNAEMLDSKLLRAHPQVRLQGYVEDVRPFYRKCAIFVAPILSGNGMRVKLLEALSMGMAVVTSPLGSRGFRARSGEQLLIANSAEEFLSSTIQLLQDKDRCAHLGSAARNLIRECYDWSAIGQQFLDLVEGRHA